jgi:hypothetical protein
MRLTFSGKLLHNTPVFGPDGQPWYQLTTGAVGGLSKVFRIRNPSPSLNDEAELTSDTTSEETLVESGVSELAMLSWGKWLPSKISIGISESYFQATDVKRSIFSKSLY